MKLRILWWKLDTRKVRDIVFTPIETEYKEVKTYVSWGAKTIWKDFSPVFFIAGVAVGAYYIREKFAYQITKEDLWGDRYWQERQPKAAKELIKFTDEKVKSKGFVKLLQLDVRYFIRLGGWGNILDAYPELFLPAKEKRALEERRQEAARKAAEDAAKKAATTTPAGRY